MKSHNDMTLDECRNELADRAGHNDIGSPGTIAFVHRSDVTRLIQAHPIPATLDAIAGAMPEGWWLTLCHEPRTDGTSVWITSASDTHEDGGVGFNGVESRSDTEILARARLAVACWRAQKGANPNG